MVETTGPTDNNNNLCNPAEEFPDEINTYETEHIMPKGYRFSVTGELELFNTSKNLWVRICMSPIWIDSTGKNIDSGEAYLKLSFVDARDSLVNVYVPKKDAYTRAGILEHLVAKGLDFNSNKANRTDHLVEYLHEYQRRNIGKLVEDTLVSKMGWKDDHKMFALGNTAYTADGEKKITHEKLREVAEALQIKGSIAEWCGFSDDLLQHPRARFKVYASCAAPLLSLLGQKTIVIDDYGESSTGKTTTNQLAISLWGNPEKLTKSPWGTQLGVTLYVAGFSDIPVVLDESQLLDQKAMEQILYTVVNEAGKLQGQKDGSLRDVKTWKSVLFTSGEKPIIQDESFTGVTARVIPLYGGLCKNDPEAVKKFRDGKEMAYGSVGPEIIKIALDPKYKPRIGKRYEENRNRFREEAGTDPLAQRLADTLATIAIGGQLFESVMGKYGFPKKDPIGICLEVYREVLESAKSQGSYAERALAHIQSWLAANHNRIAERIGKRTEYPHNNISIISVLDKEEGIIDLLPSELNKELKNSGYDHKRLMKDLKEKGTIVCNNGLKYNVVIDGKTVAVYRLKIEKMPNIADFL